MEESKEKVVKKNSAKKAFIMMSIGIVLLILLDQVIKSIVVANYASLPIELFGGIIRVSYTKNLGAALGIANSNLIVSVLTNLLVLAIIIRFVIKQNHMIDTKTRIALIMMISGGFSNLIDRIFRQGVVDYIDLSAFMKFPLFNIADTVIIVGWILFALFAAINTVRVSRQIKEEGERKQEELERIKRNRKAKEEKKVKKKWK